MNIRLFQTNCIIINTCKLYFNVYVTNLYTYKRKQLRNGNIGLFSVNKYLDTHIPFKVWDQQDLFLKEIVTSILLFIYYFLIKHAYRF